MEAFGVFSVFWFSFSSLCCITAQTDPCINPEDISNELRKPNRIFRSGTIALCDRFLDPNLWYYLGGMITQECVALQKCSTYSGIWYNGTYPIGNEIVSGKVCAINKANNCCGWSGIIQIKKCSNNTYVHKLAIPNSCPISYCVGSNIPCLVAQVYHSQTMSCWNVPVINTTTLSKPYISAYKLSTTDSGPFNTTAFSVDCETNLVGYISPSNSTAKLKIEAIFKMDEDVVFSYTNEFSTKVSVNEKNLIGHLGKSLSCALRFYYEFKDGSQSTKTDWVNSTKYFMGIQPVDLNGNVLPQVKMGQGERTKINFMATFPITTRHCWNDTVCMLPIYEFYMNITRVHSAGCFIFFGTSNGSISYTSWPPVEISAVSTPGQEYTTTEIKFASFIDTNYEENLLQNYIIPLVVIQIEEKQVQPTCHSIGDPHILTLSNFGFNNFYTGDFYLIKAKRRTFEVQVRQVPCPGPSITCNCGIIVREENYIIGVTACDDLPAPTTFQFMLDDTVNPRATMDINGTVYTIKFVSGITIRIENWLSYMSIFMNVLKNEEYDGICSITSELTDFNKFRISYKESFFKNMYPACVNESFNFPLCKCENLEKNTYTDANVSCGANLTQTQDQIITFVGVCNSRRKKRSITSPNNVHGINIEDIFRTINGSIESSKNDPVSTNFSSDLANQTCYKSFKSFPLYDKCVEILDKTVIEILKNNCITDMKLTGNTVFANMYLSVFGQVCKQNLEKQFVITNGNLAPNSSNLQKDLEKIEASICPICLNGGKCVSGSCVCSTDFGDIDCSVNLTKPPVISLLSKNSFCDILSQQCHLIHVRAGNLKWVNNMTTTCRGSIIDASGNTTEIDMSTSLIQPGLLQCSINMDALNQQRQQQSKIKLILKVTTSNVVKMLESNELNLIIFNGSCLDCSSDDCILKYNFCILNNVCYEAFYMNDGSRQCISSSTTTQRPNNMCSWIPMINTNSPGGTHQVYTTFDVCQSQCLAMKDTTCKYGFDWDPSSPPGYQCWFATSTAMSTYNGVYHYIYQCTPDTVCSWTYVNNTNSPGGNQQSYTTLDLCASQCLAMKDTTCRYGFDWNPSDPPGFQCWFSTSTATNLYYGVYHVTYNCSATRTNKPATTSNIPGVCKWTEYLNSYTSGGRLQANYNTVDDCQTACLQTNYPCTYGIDFNNTASTGSKCWFSTSSFNNEVSYSSSHYQRTC